MEEAKNELADYKQKAARILASKEKLINSLKEGTTSSSGEAVSIEHTELIHERDMLKEEIQQANAKIEQLRLEVSVGQRSLLLLYRESWFLSDHCEKRIPWL